MTKDDIACKNFLPVADKLKGTRPFVNTSSSVDGAFRIIECLRMARRFSLAREFAEQIAGLEICKNAAWAERITATLQRLDEECDQPVATLPVAIDGDTSLWIRGLNFASAMVRWTAAGMPRRTKQEIEERLAICQACPELLDKHCRMCGCACIEQNQLMNKLALATEVCPLGKWK